MFIAGFVVWVLFGVITMMAAQKKGRDGCAWFLIGALLGPFGFIIALLTDPIEEPTVSNITTIHVSQPVTKVVDYKPAEVEVEYKNFFIDEITLNRPLQALSYELTFFKDSREATLKSFTFRNIQKAIIKYSEWLVTCYDILNREISSDAPVVLKFEGQLKPRETYTYSDIFKLPKETKSIKLQLTNVLLENGEINNFENIQEEKTKYESRKITSIGNFNVGFQSFLKKEFDLVETPTYIFEEVEDKYWLCSICGVLNWKEDLSCKLCNTEFEKIKNFDEDNLLILSKNWSEQQEMIKEREREIEELKKAAKEKATIEKRQHTIKVLAIILISFVLIVGGGYLIWESGLNNHFAYRKATSLFNEQNYYDASNQFLDIPYYKDSEERALESYALYIETSLDLFNKSEGDELIAAYTWLLNNNFPKEKVFNSIFNIYDDLVKEKQVEILYWLYDNDFEKFIIQ